IAWNSHWSPNGKRIAFTGKNPEGTLAIFVVNSDGSNPRQVTHLAAAEGQAQWPTWSPDGNHLAFQVNQVKEKTAHIWIVDIATGKAHQIAPHQDAYLDETPAWSADGKFIAFQSNRNGTVDVWVMAADGSGQHQLTGAKPAGRK